MNASSSLTTNSTNTINEDGTPQSLDLSLSCNPKRKRRYKIIGYRGRKGKKRKKNQPSLLPLPSLGMPSPQSPPKASLNPLMPSNSPVLSPITLLPSPSPPRLPVVPSPPSTPAPITLSLSSSPSPSPPPPPPHLPVVPSPALTTIAYGPKGMRMTTKQAESMRITIDTVFRQKYANTYTSEKLNGKDGVVQSICRDIHYFWPTTVRRVVLQSYVNIQNENEYNAKKKKFVKESK